METKLTVEVDLAWVVGLFNYIDPPPVVWPEGHVTVFNNPNAAQTLHLLSEHVRKFKAVPKLAPIYDSTLAAKVAATGAVAIRDAIISLLRHELEESRKFIADAFKAHPNLDLDIEMMRNHGL